MIICYFVAFRGAKIALSAWKAKKMKAFVVFLTKKVGVIQKQ